MSVPGLLTAHENYHAPKCWNANSCWHFNINKHDKYGLRTWKQVKSLFFSILVFRSSWDFMLIWVEHENSFFYNLGALPLIASMSVPGLSEVFIFDGIVFLAIFFVLSFRARPFSPDIVPALMVLNWKFISINKAIFQIIHPYHANLF